MEQRVSLAPLSTLGVGGPARWFCHATKSEDVASAHAWSEEHGRTMFVLGGGSNVVVADEGFGGLVLRIGLRGVSVAADDGDTLVTAAAGESWDELVAVLVARGLAGVECLSGIPGTVGGTPIQNVGAYGQQVEDTIESVGVYDRTTAAMTSLSAAECGFAYRMSRFKSEDANRFVVCAVTFRLRSGRPTITYPDLTAYLERRATSDPSVADVRDAVLEIRRRKGMVVDAADPDSRSVGSFFMNPIVTSADRERIASIAGERPPGFAVGDQIKVPAAWLIERAGFAKGHVSGEAGISAKHPLALINRGAATADEILGLATRIKRAVVDRFGVWLRPEPVFVGLDGHPDVIYLLAAN